MRRWFGPSQEEIWRQLSQEIGARYVDGGFWNGDKVEVTHGAWTVTLDTYVVSTGKTFLVFTRMRAPYANAEDFRFAVTRANFFSGIAKWFGAQDVTIGYEQFDEEYVVKSNDEERVRTLLANPRIRELLDAQPHLHFGIKSGDSWLESRLPADVDALEFHVMGVIKDVDRLKQLYDLFAETLDGLCELGVAYERTPDLSR